jgi:HEAT repeat protein
MKIRLSVLLAAFWGLSWMAAGAALDSSSLKAALEQHRQYEFGQSRRGLVEIEQQIASVYQQPEELSKAEAVLLEVLQSDCSFALKDFICRRLSIIGTARSVPVLAGLLKEPKTAALAEYALVRIPSEEVDRVLAEHLASAEPSIQIGLLSTLGLRKSKQSVSAIAPLMTASDLSVAEAAVGALGQIGTAEAAQALEQRAEQTAPALKNRLADSLLACADNLRQQAGMTEAEKIYAKVYRNPAYSDLIHSAALQGLVETVTPAERDRLLLEALSGSEEQVRMAAVQAACRLRRAEVIEKIRRQMNDLSVLEQVRFVAALGEFKAPSAKETALACLSSESDEVVLAALETLSVVGDASCVKPLSQTAAAASNPRIRQAARETLVQLPDTKADEVLADLLNQADFQSGKVDQAVEWVRAAGQRNVRAALPALIRAASAESRPLRREALEALALTAEPADLAQMIDLLRIRPDSDVIKMLAAVGRKEGPRKGAAKPVLAFLNVAPGPESIAAAYQLLGQLGDPDSLEVLRAGLKSENPALQEAAFRGLTDWPGPEVMEEMKHLAAEGQSESRRVLAFRAYVRMIRQSEQTPSEKARLLTEALALAPRESEKKIVLAALGQYPDERTLEAAVSCLGEESIRAEAQAAVLAICERLAARQPEPCRKALRKVLESSPSEETAKRAQKLLNTL